MGLSSCLPAALLHGLEYPAPDLIRGSGKVQHLARNHGFDPPGHPP